jgi:hypothetical protein
MQDYLKHKAHPLARSEVGGLGHAQRYRWLHARYRHGQYGLQAENQATRSVGRSWWAWCRQPQCWAARCHLDLCCSRGSALRQLGAWHRPVCRWTTATTSRCVHSADAVLLAAADAVGNATMKLMAEKSDLASDQAQPQLRNQQRDGSVVCRAPWRP